VSIGGMKEEIKISCRRKMKGKEGERVGRKTGN